jgi:membrane protein
MERAPGERTAEQHLPPEQDPPAARYEPPQEGSPRDIPARGWTAALKNTAKEIKSDRVTFTAGALAYYWFLALFPAVIALIGLITIIDIARPQLQSLVTGVTNYVPPGTSNVLTSAIKQAGSKTSGGTVAVVVGLAVAVWSASSGMAALTTGLNVAYDVSEDRKFIPKRINALFLMLIVLVFGGIAAALLVFGGPIGNAIKDQIGFGEQVFLWAWTVVRWVGAILTAAVLFSALYFFGPKRESPHWQWVTIGGIVGMIIWLAASAGFSFYITSFGSYGKTYGAFAGVAILILWLYLTGLAVLIGAELNAELERQKQAVDRSPRSRA